jgi:hypothetical protein
MEMLGRRDFLRYTTLVVSLSLLFCAVPQSAQERQALPSQITDEEFWRIVEEFSEDGGQFNSENFSSNERGYQLLIPRLQATVSPGGVYMGVGPEQNFQYIASLKPAMAFIVDIRRQNLIQHLMYKAAFELSVDRADFLSRIFSRKRPEGLGPESTARQLMEAYRAAYPDPDLAAANMQVIRDVLIKDHNFRLGPDDEGIMHYVVDVFAMYGTGLNYGSSLGGTLRVGNGNQPSYGDLISLEDEQGQNRSFLASEESYNVIREMQKNNLIIPVVGDFGGAKAIRAVGQYIREHNATVMAFYLSNVEQYLFQPQGRATNGGWQNFYRSVATLPLDETSTFIRSGNTQGLGRGGGLTPVMSSMLEVIRAFNDGRLTTFSEALKMSGN